MYKKFISGICALALILPQMLLAADPTEFRVEIIPDTFQVDEPVDLKVSALAADGSVISDFDGNIFITVDLPQAQYVVPSDGIYTFLETDQ
jgi:hypothetical protein